MTDKTKPTDHDQQPISGAKDERIGAGELRGGGKMGESPDNGGGVNGPMNLDRRGYKTHYGETAYGGGQKRYDGQQPVTGADVGERPSVPRREGKAGSKATLPGAGAEHGPPGKS